MARAKCNNARSSRRGVRDRKRNAGAARRVPARAGGRLVRCERSGQIPQRFAGAAEIEVDVWILRRALRRSFQQVTRPRRIPPPHRGERREIERRDIVDPSAIAAQRRLLAETDPREQAA